MKPQLPTFVLVLVSLSIFGPVAGCSTLTGTTTDRDMAVRGPTVINARSEPSTVELNRNFQPLQRTEILADVKDFDSKVSKVTVKFTQIPMQLPMKNIGGTTWRAELNPEQLRNLAVSGKTIKYEARIEARDQKGQVSNSHDMITVAIKAPDLSYNKAG